MEKPPVQGGADSKPLTTFVHADTRNFKEVVQRLTGPTEADTSVETTVSNGNVGVKKSAFKLHERRQYRAKLEIVKPPLNYWPGSSSSLQGELKSPEQQNFSSSRSWNWSPLSTPTKCFSDLTLAQKELAELNTEEEEKAIKERRFYLHQSPRSKRRFSEPPLLNLFPMPSADRKE